MNFTLAELTRLKLEPGEVLAVKLYGDDYEQESVTVLQEHLKKLFPNNKIAMFVLPNGNDLQMEVISTVENSEFSHLSPAQKEAVKNSLDGIKAQREQGLTTQDIVDSLVKADLGDCSKPQSYCSDCGCGKKERIESENE